MNDDDKEIKWVNRKIDDQFYKDMQRHLEDEMKRASRDIWGQVEKQKEYLYRHLGYSWDHERQVSPEEVRIRELERVVHRHEMERNSRHLEELEEAHLRKTYPALQDAWEQYQAIKKLVKNA